MERSLLSLPIDRDLPEIVRLLRSERNLIVQAAPGSGKTTRVPSALLELGGEVLVLEPRRIAARMAARRVAFERNETVGQTVGFQVRFEDVSSARTRLRFLTEGVLIRRLITDPLLHRVSTVVLDEFHERHLDTDLALALLRRLQQSTRPDLRIVVMSATIDAFPISVYLDSCPIVSSEGRVFPIEVEHLPYSPAPLENRVASALETTPPHAEVLVFLPGAAEIRKASRTCESIAKRQQRLVLPLHGDLSPAEQDLAVTPGDRPKIILSTNIAESSITIEGVTCIIDSGLARMARDSPWTGLPSLNIGRISKASALQRAGRAGRTAPGRAIRLYTLDDFVRRPDHDLPEIERRELSQMLLQLRAMEIPVEGFPWFDPPPPEALQAASELLDRLGATAENARQMARLPVHPRLARLILSASHDGSSDEACRAAAIITSADRGSSSDILERIDRELTPRARDTYAQLRRIAPSGKGAPAPHGLPLAILRSFPDRVAARRGDGQYMMASGQSIQAPAARDAFLIAIDVEEREDRGLPLVRLICPILPDWLLDVFPERVAERNGVEWNREAQRAEAVQALVYDNLVFDETRGGMPDPESAAELLAAKALESGIERFIDGDALAGLRARALFASAYGPVAPLDDSVIHEAFRSLAFGLRSFAELQRVAPGLLPELERKVGGRALEEIAPARLRLPSGRTTPVHYEMGKPPWIASRLQDFFGLIESPRVARGQVPLVIHLLAPNGRPVQTTTDLAGFWQRLYPQLRRELGRRYPKHKWPENPV